jgi:hypothetical protein
MKLSKMPLNLGHQTLTVFPDTYISLNIEDFTA